MILRDIRVPRIAVVCVPLNCLLLFLFLLTLWRVLSWWSLEGKLTAPGSATAGVGKVELSTAWEASCSSREPSGGSEAASTKTALVAHHTKQNLWVNSTHAAHTPATKHVCRVHEIVAIVIGSLFPMRGLVYA